MLQTQLVTTLSLYLILKKNLKKLLYNVYIYLLKNKRNISKPDKIVFKRFLKIGITQLGGSCQTIHFCPHLPHYSAVHKLPNTYLANSNPLSVALASHKEQPPSPSLMCYIIYG